MKIITSMHLALATAAATAVAFAVAGLSFHHAQRNSVEQRQTLYRIVQGVAELHIRTDEYMDRSRFDIRPLQQWRMRDEAVGEDLARIRGDLPEAKRLIESLTARHHQLEAMFAKLIGLRGSSDTDSLAYIRQERMLGRLYVLLEEQFSEADELRRLSDEADREALAYAVALGSGTLVLMMASVVLCAFIVRRNLSTPMQRMIAATEAIGSGDLEHRIDSAADDEIGVLSRAFDKMAERLQQMTASRNDLAHARTALRRLNATLEERVATRTAALERMHEQLHQAQKMEAVGQLTGGIAHDFNNLLASIVGNVEMMQVRIRQERYDELPRYAGAIMAVTERATALTHRLLAFSRRQALDPRPVDAKMLVTSMRELIQRAVGPAIRIETILHDSPCVTLCDANQLESAVLNLAINARDAMPQGGQLTIEIAPACMAPQDLQHVGDAQSTQSRLAEEHVMVSVSDTGIGMAQNTVARAFDPFFTTKAPGQGTGLGLSMVYGFVKQSGGHVTIDSAPGRGTTVRLYLPQYRGAAEPADSRSKPAALPRADRTFNVLVVDDEPEVRKTAIEMLQELGYTAIAAASADECIAILQSPEPVDLLITDVGLPGDTDGWRLADKARELRPRLKVLFITGYTQSGPVPAGAGEILTKPFAMDAFAVKVCNVMSSPQAEHCAQT